jgi:hypothetical protein
MTTELKSQAMSTEMRNWLKGYFDGIYSASAHNHSGIYSPAAHDHNGVYSLENHSHPYALASHFHWGRQVVYHHLNGATVGAGATTYITPSIAGFTSLNGIVWPVAGQFINMAVRINSIQSATGSLVFTVMKNLVDQPSLILTVPAGSGASTNWYLSNSPCGFNAGDMFTVKVKNNATAASAQITTFSIEYQAPTV